MLCYYLWLWIVNIILNPITETIEMFIEANWKWLTDYDDETMDDIELVVNSCGNKNKSTCGYWNK